MFFTYLDLPTDYFVKYYLEDFIPKNRVIEKMLETNALYFQVDKLNSTTIYLEYLLEQKFNKKLKIQYFHIFQHHRNQDIHIDGNKEIRNCSLNLPLINFDNTETRFYKTKTSIPSFLKTDAIYYNGKEDLEVAETLPGSQKWVLINSGVFHNVITENKNKPRITVSFRFKGNPKFENLYNLFNSL